MGEGAKREQTGRPFLVHPVPGRHEPHPENRTFACRHETRGFKKAGLQNPPPGFPGDLWLRAKARYMYDCYSFIWPVCCQ